MESSRHHHRTANEWKIYPMYDYAHGESDYLEQISHSICTLEFVMHRELYNWFLDQIYDANKVRPNQYEFARLNLNYTVMSKRKLLQLVQENYVDGWDDPRMPTISGLRRRGYTPNSIRKFCDIIGREIGATDQHVRQTTDQAHNQHVFWLVLDMLEGVGGEDGFGLRGNQDTGAIGGVRQHFLGADGAAGTGQVFYNNGLPDCLLQQRLYFPCYTIGRISCGLRHKDRHIL